MDVPRGLIAAALDSLPAEVAILDATGTIVYTNEQWREFGAENDLVSDASSVGVDYLAVCEGARDDEYAQQVYDGLRAILDGDREEFQLEYPCHSPDERRWFLMVASRLSYEGDPYVLVGHLDITDRRLAEERVHEKNQLLEGVAGILSHDLRNPLSVALGSLEMVSPSDETEADTLDRIESSLDRMDAIIADALLLARKTTVQETEPVDLREVAERAWSHVEHGESTLRVPETTVFVADASLLNSLFENLFRNAVRHAGPEVTVEVGPLPDGFYVEDDGPGIPPEARERVFEPGSAFSPDPGGTGLGLTIVQSIAASHEWDVAVADGPMGGARFEVTGVTAR